MKIHSSRLNRLIEKFADFFFLNLLWIIFSLPIVTIFPATVAMYGVVRKWVMKKESEGVFQTFLHLFRESFRQSFGISILWFSLAYIGYLDFQLFQSNTLFLSVLFVFVILFFSVTVYLFPAMAHLETTWINIIKNSLLMAVSNPFSTIGLLGIWLVFPLLVYLFPISIILLGSVSAHLSYSIFHRLFTNKIKGKINFFNKWEKRNH
jgi:uncharacterized membrane protein YesL